MMKIVRKILGAIILFLDALTRPKKMLRSESEQRIIDAKTQNLSLYQFHACPFCVKVRRVIHKLNINITLRDAQKDEKYRSELLKGGGKVKVPCLRIEEKQGVEWLYESNDIIKYLEASFSKNEQEGINENSCC